MTTNLIAHAKELGASLEVGASGWSWRYGMRSSADQHATCFPTQMQAAKHFLASHEGKIAQEQYDLRMARAQ